MTKMVLFVPIMSMLSLSVLYFQGVPIRIEIGPRDVQKAEFVAVRRDTGDKVTLKLSDAVKAVTKMLDDVQTSMFTK